MAEKKELLEKLKSRELLLEPKAFELLAACDDALELADELAANYAKSTIVSEGEMSAFLESRRLQKQVIQVEVRPAASYDPPAKNVQSRLELCIKGTAIAEESRCGGSIDDFVGHFRDRFERQRDSLRRFRAASGGIQPLSEAKTTLKNKEFRVIVMVYDKRTTKNGHLLVEVEDEDSSANCLVPKDSPLFEEANRILPDEVVALDVYSSASSLLIIKGIARPGQMLQERRKKLVEEDISMAFLSDIHVGSKLFLHENFRKFIDFINGKGSKEEQEIAGKIKYVSIAGDNVDGIGVYPTQEKQLATKDIYLQYEMLCEYLKSIPEHVEVIVIPGNHDAVRTAEPQPALPDAFTEHVKGYSNIHFAPSPSRHLVHGLDLLSYHGTSIDGVIAHAPHLREAYNKPEIIGAYLLEKRHLLPYYGEDPLVPEKHDRMLIEGAPDIFHFGHVHKNGYLEDYNGTFIVNAGTWQARTDFQVRMGHNPTPCLLPVYNLNTGRVKVLNFNV